jgi:hypothetical protein
MPDEQRRHRIRWKPQNLPKRQEPGDSLCAARKHEATVSQFGPMGIDRAHEISRLV